MPVSEKLDFRGTRTMRLTRALVEACERWREADFMQIARYGLHPSEFDVLVHLGVEQPQKMTALASSTLLTKSNCTRVMKCLEGKGLARRVRCPESDREVWAVLTPAGEELFERVYPQHYDYLKALYARTLSEAQQEQLIQLLRRVAASE